MEPQFKVFDYLWLIIIDYLWLSQGEVEVINLKQNLRSEFTAHKRINNCVHLIYCIIELIC